jgi:hypothetical protein
MLETAYAQGMAAGRNAATADALDTTTHGAVDDVLQMAWDVVSGRTDELELAQQEEYCIGWTYGYRGLADDIEGDLDTWEDDGGRIA